MKRAKKPVVVTLIGKPDCHLCDEARAVVEKVVDGLRAELRRGTAAGEAKDGGAGLVIEEDNILENAELARLYSEEIPVVQVNGRRIAIWHVEEDRLRAAIAKALGMKMRKRRFF